MSYDQDRDVCSHCGDPINCEGHCERAIRRQEASNAFNAAVERMRAEGSYLYPFDGPGLGVELDAEKMASMTVESACEP